MEMNTLVRYRIPILVIAIVLGSAFAVFADVYYNVENGVFYLSNYQKTEQFAVAIPAQDEGEAVELSFQPTEFETVLLHYCSLYGVDINLVKAVMMAESRMRHYTDDDTVLTSEKGAVGIMQVMPATGASIGLPNVQDMEENIHAGVKYLSMMLRRFNNNVVLALAAYNAGPEAVEQYKGIPPYAETRNYVQVVLRYYRNGVNVDAPNMTNSTVPLKPLRQFRDEKGNVILTNIY